MRGGVGRRTAATIELSRAELPFKILHIGEALSIRKLSLRTLDREPAASPELVDLVRGRGDRQAGEDRPESWLGSATAPSAHLSPDEASAA